MSQKPIDAHVSVNGRGPAKLGGMSEAKVFESKVASLEAKASIFAAKTMLDRLEYRHGRFSLTRLLAKLPQVD